jgi:hypothetical protein
MSDAPPIAVDFTDIRNFPRQVHLDFHTSPLIPDVAADFDPEAFAAAFAAAHVQSVTVFAKCHHGMSYYPTKVGRPHPNLKRPDLLGEMIEALHRRGIRAPIYTTVAFEEDVAARFPQWRQMRADGAFASVPGAGGWRFNEWLHPDYQDYIEAHITELLDAYPVDGLFFDILFHDADAISAQSAIDFRSARGLLATDHATVQRFETAAQLQFVQRFTGLIHGRAPRAGIFYNMPNVLHADSCVGSAAIAPFRTQWEIESLPSGTWGYYHFPRQARRAIASIQPWLGMTGRFQKSWGDFGGIKPTAALEFECFRSQALGGGNSVGDQLHPRGRLDAGVYRLVKSVYGQCASASDFYRDSRPLPQVGIFPASGAVDDVSADLSLEGAVQMCEESHYDAVVLDDSCELAGLAAVILPDAATVTPRLVERLRAFLAAGGKVIASHQGGFTGGGFTGGGFNGAGQWALAAEIPLVFDGPVDTVPTYWRPRAEFLGEQAESDRVVYQPGMSVKLAGAGGRVLVDRVPPYFPRRTDLTFSSHFQAPPKPAVDPDRPAVLAGEQWVYFADPIFRDYRQSGNGIVRDAWRAAMELLIGPPPFGAGLPTTMLIYPRRCNDDLRLTLLHYVPVRKAIDIDVVEERMGFAGETLRLPVGAESVRVFGTGESLARSAVDGSFALPAAKGRLLLQVPGFFAADDPLGAVMPMARWR